MAGVRLKYTQAGGIELLRYREVSPLMLCMFVGLRGCETNIEDTNNTRRRAGAELAASCILHVVRWDRGRHRGTELLPASRLQVLDCLGWMFHGPAVHDQVFS
jgi:hypothetical protein